MSLYQRTFDRVLTKIDPETTHRWAGEMITVAGARPLAPLVRATLRGAAAPDSSPWRIWGRILPGPLGIAAGFDKNATMALGLAAMGFAFVEVGTITARPQPGNVKPRLFRHPTSGALVNRMGFNNSGAHAAAERLARLRRTPDGKRLLIGANIGKSKVTPAADAVADYVTSARAVAPYADYLVVNVSSPNTPGLRDLQTVPALRPILAAVTEQAAFAAGEDRPVLVKIAPDLAAADIDAIADLVAELGLAGVSAVNTTISHQHGAGGLSGAPLLDRGLAVVQQLRSRMGPGPVIIGTGGISAAADADDYLVAGANLVQAYTGFIYGGPRWPGVVNRQLTAATD